MNWADWNWVDWLIIAALTGSVVGGFAEGFVRTTIGFVSLILGFFVASWFYRIPAESIQAWVDNPAVASVCGFALILSGVLILGSLVAWLIQRVLKIVGLSWLDRIAGGGFGLVRGVVGLAVMALVFTSLMPGRLPKATAKSELAPYIFGTAEALAAVAPYELRNGFKRSYEQVLGVVRQIQDTKKGNSE